MKEKQVLSFWPEPDFYHKRAAKSIEKGAFAAALKNLRRASELQPDDLGLRVSIADTYARMGLYERSNLELQLIFHRPSLPTEALYGMASNYMALGDYEQAEVMFHGYLCVAPEGEFADQAGEALDYIADCDYETPLDRELDELSMDGKAALDAGDLEYAVDCLRRALDKDPSMTYVRNNLAMAYYCMGDMEKAWAQTRQVLAESPMDVHGRCNESMLYLVEGNVEQAVEAVRRLQLERIEEIDELFKYCLALADVGLDEELMQALKKMFLACPYDVSMLYLCGACQYNQGRYQESLRTFEKLSLIEPDSLLAGWGLKTADAAVRDGKPPVERIPYAYDLPDEVYRRLDARLAALAELSAQEVARALEDAETLRLVRGAAMMGSEEQMRQAVALLGYGGGPGAERVLRELLLSPTHSTFYKQMVVEALRVMRAKEPFYGLQDGKMVSISSRSQGLGGDIPPSYMKVLEEMLERMMQAYGEDAANYAVRAWMAYCFGLEGDYPRIANRSAWIGAAEGMYLESIGQRPDWDALAEQLGVKVRTMRLRKAKLERALRSMSERNDDKDEE